MTRQTRARIYHQMIGFARRLDFKYHYQTFNDIGCPVEFAQGVRPADYKLFQLTDLVCSLRLVSSKLAAGLPLSESEVKFSGGYRAFKKSAGNLLRSKRI